MVLATRRSSENYGLQRKMPDFFLARGYNKETGSTYYKNQKKIIRLFV